MTPSLFPRQHRSNEPTRTCADRFHAVSLAEHAHLVAIGGVNADFHLAQCLDELVDVLGLEVGEVVNTPIIRTPF